MRKINYDNQNFPLRLEFPITWKPQDIQEIKLQILDDDGYDGYSFLELDCTVYPGATLDASVEKYSNSIKLNSSCTPLYEGDWIKIFDGYSSENVEISTYCHVAKTAVLREHLRFDHAAGAQILGMFCVVILDTSDTEIFTKGKNLTLIWNPGAVGPVVAERAQILQNSFQIPGLEKRFSALFPRAYDILIRDGIINQIMEESLSQVTVELKLRNLDVDKILGGDIIVQLMLYKMRYLTLLSGDSSLADERQLTKIEYNDIFNRVCLLPIWQDNNMDQKKSSDEVSSNEPFFNRGI